MVNVSTSRRGRQSPRGGGFSELNRNAAAIRMAAEAQVGGRLPYETERGYRARVQLAGFEALAAYGNPLQKRQALAGIANYQAGLAEEEGKRQTEMQLAQRGEREFFNLQVQQAVTDELAKREPRLPTIEQTFTAPIQADPIISTRQPELATTPKLTPAQQSKIGIGAGAVVLLAVVAIALSRGKKVGRR